MAENNIESWEKEVREKLMKSVEHGPYKLPFSQGIIYTGKLGYIDFVIACIKELRKTV